MHCYIFNVCMYILYVYDIKYMKYMKASLDKHIGSCPIHCENVYCINLACFGKLYYVDIDK